MEAIAFWQRWRGMLIAATEMPFQTFSWLHDATFTPFLHWQDHVDSRAFVRFAMNRGLPLMGFDYCHG